MDKPVGVIGNWGRIEWADNVFPQLGDKMYAAPQKKEWVGLPNDEVLERANKFRDPEMYLRGVLWAEAKLKEKNT